MIFKHFYSGKDRDVNINHHKINWNEAPSKEQQILQDFLKPYWKNKIILAEFPIPGSKFRIDILNISDRIGIEYSPSSSHDYNPFFHGHQSGFHKRVKYDLDKLEWLEKNNFQPIEIIKEDLKHLSLSFFRDKFSIKL